MSETPRSRSRPILFEATPRPDTGEPEPPPAWPEKVKAEWLKWVTPHLEEQQSQERIFRAKRDHKNLFWDTGSFLELLSQRISSLPPHKNGIVVQIELRRDSFPFKQIQKNITASFEQSMRLKEIHIVLMNGVLSLVRGQAPSWLSWRDISNRSYFTDPKNGLMRFEFHFLDLTQPEKPLLAAVKDWHPPKTITPIHEILRTAREAKGLSLQDASQKLTQVLGYAVRKEKLVDYEGDWDKAIPFDMLIGLAEVY